MGDHRFFVDECTTRIYNIIRIEHELNKKKIGGILCRLKL